MADPIITPEHPPVVVPQPLPNTVLLNPPMVGTASPFERVDGQNRDLILEAIRTWARVTLTKWTSQWQTDLTEWLNDTNNWLDSWNADVVRYVQETVAELTAAVDERLDENEATLNTRLAENEAAMLALDASVEERLASNLAVIDAAVQQVINSSIEVQDPVVAGILGNPASDTRVVGDLLYASAAAVNARTRLVSGGATATDRARLNTAIDEASQAGAPLVVRGVFNLAGAPISPTVPVVLDSRQAVLNQMDNLRPALILSEGSTMVGGTINGKGTDWVNTAAVYPAAGVQIAAAAKNITLDSVKVLNMAGSGVDARFAGEGLRLINCHLRGVGGSIIPGTTGQWSGGLVSYDLANFSVIGGSIAGFAQGIVTGFVDRVFVGAGVEISSVGQHGIYFGSVKRGAISGARIIGVPLQGIKSQLWTPEEDTEQFTIGDTVVKDTGSHGILLTNVQTTGFTLRHRRVSIHDTMIDNLSSTGDAINLRELDGVTIHDVGIRGYNVGIRVLNTNRLRVHHVDIERTLRSAISMSQVTRSAIESVDMTDIASLSDAADRFGILVGGANSRDIRFAHNTLTDAVGNAQYGLYLAGGTQNTYEVLHNTMKGLSSHGFRSAGGDVKTWIGNDLEGATGRFFNMPANVGTIPDTSGATLANLEIEVNRLKERLRQSRQINA